MKEEKVVVLINNSFIIALFCDVRPIKIKVYVSLLTSNFDSYEKKHYPINSSFIPILIFI